MERKRRGDPRFRETLNKIDYAVFILTHPKISVPQGILRFIEETDQLIQTTSYESDANKTGRFLDRVATYKTALARARQTRDDLKGK